MSGKGIEGIENKTAGFLEMIKLPLPGSKVLNYLFVIPAAPQLEYGVAYVCSALKSSGRNVFTLNLNLASDPKRTLAHKIVKENIDVVFTGSFSSKFWETKTVVDTVKQVSPGIITVVGGAMISVDPAVAMEALENADYGVIGEGEITVNALAYELETKNSAADVPGVIYRRNGKWTVNECSNVITDPDILPFPDHSGFELYKVPEQYTLYNSVVMNNVVYINIGRSCPYGCTFCANPDRGRYRSLSLDTVFKHLDWLDSLYHIESLILAASIGFPDAQYAYDFSRRIKPYNLKWYINARPEVITREMLSVMKESGCIGLLIGVESADSKILKSMRKSTTIEQVERAFRLAEEVGLHMEGNLLFGDSEDTLETALRSIEWRMEHPGWRIAPTHIYHFPGSQLYKKACREGLIKDPVEYLKDGYPKINASKMSNDEYFKQLPFLFSLLNKDKLLTGAQVELNDGFSINITGNCPYCSKVIKISGLDTIFSRIVQHCPFCENPRPVAASAIELCDLTKLRHNIQTLCHEKAVGIWGVTIYNIYLLLDAVPCLKEDNVLFINNNNNALAFMGKEVFTPDIIKKTSIDTVLIPNSLRVFKDIKEQCVNEFPQVKQIAHITELL